MYKLDASNPTVATLLESSSRKATAATAVFLPHFQVRSPTVSVSTENSTSVSLNTLGDQHHYHHSVGTNQQLLK